jgi:hypothetical protein
MCLTICLLSFCLLSLFHPPSSTQNSYVYLGRGAPQLAEGVRESVKNLMLVMSASGVFDAAQYETGGELWELAWAVIDAFYPELRAEMWPSQQPQQEPQPPTDGSGSGDAQA